MLQVVSNPPAYRPDVDGLRAVAVLGVIFYHLGFAGFGGGFVGVDVFFVVSGFLITRLIRSQISTGTFTFGNFYVRRVRRLFPALMFTWIGCLVAGAALFSTQYFQRFGGALSASILSISNFYFWRESGYFDTDAVFKPLLHTWSLSVEEQFYLVWPATLSFLLFKTPKWFPLVFLVVAGTASLFFTEVWLNSDPSGAFYLAPFRVIEFAIGAVLVWAVDHQPESKLVLEPLVLAGLALILYPILAFDESTRFPGLNALIPCIGTALIIYAGTARYTGKILNNRILVGIGLISYSLYLIHWPIIVFYSYHKSLKLDDLEKAAILVLSLAAATLMFRYVEMPFRHDRHKVRSSRAFGFASFVSALLLSLVAASVWAGSGWPWRMEVARDLLSQETPSDYRKARFGGIECTILRCQLRTENTQKIYVVGDSHANAYLEGMTVHMKEHSVIFWKGAECQLFSMDYNQDGKDGKRCRWVKKMAYEEIDQSSSPVIVAQSWITTYMMGKRGRIVSSENEVAELDSMEQFVSFVIEELENTKKALQIDKLVVIGGVPRFGRRGSPFDCVDRPVFDPECLVSNEGESRLKYHKEFNDLMSQRLGKDILFLDPYSALCADGECVNFTGEFPIYSDSDHLSERGSRFVVGSFAEPLTQFLAR